jgi:hypothetical protein
MVSTEQQVLMVQQVSVPRELREQRVLCHPAAEILQNAWQELEPGTQEQEHRVETKCWNRIQQFSHSLTWGQHQPLQQPLVPL